MRHLKRCEFSRDQLTQVRICENCNTSFSGRFTTFCSESCGKSLSNKKRDPGSEETIKKISQSLKENSSWIKHSSENREIIDKKCLKCETTFQTSAGSGKSYCSTDCARRRKASLETRQKLSKALKGKSGGVRKGGGRGKHGWYRGIWCDSSWELAWVIYSLENGVAFKRNTRGFEYEFQGKKFKYFPDFQLEDGSYVEIKGYDTQQSEEKHRQFPGKLQVLKKTQMKAVLHHVIDHYGHDYIKLYESTL